MASAVSVSPQRGVGSGVPTKREKPVAVANRKLLAQTEFFNNSTVSVYVLLLEIGEKITPVTYHLEKTSSGVVVIFVDFQVFGEVVDSPCENGDLNLR